MGSYSSNPRVQANHDRVSKMTDKEKANAMAKVFVEALRDDEDEK